MSAKNKPQVRDRAGPVSLGDKIGHGGEGAVYAVNGRPEIVAKVYHKLVAVEKAAKIEAMASMKNSTLASFTAWPNSLLHNSQGEPCGLLMPRVSGHKDIHKLYNPGSRKKEFQTADWRFLVRAATNTARAFAAVHDSGCVIGDVNHGGVTVSDKATIKLIDCDSFQVTANGRRFLCEVGVPPFTPPELQGQSFRGVIRSPNHDNFGLAVLVFHLLFMGKHPFSGRYLGGGDVSLEQNIRELRFAYGRSRAAMRIEPPPYAPDVAIASSSVVLLFERAFAREGISGLRPGARDWIAALDDLEKQFKQCKVNSSHYHLGSLAQCPWCAYETAVGVVLFNIRVSISPAGKVDVSSAWAKISAVTLPPEPLLPSRVSTPPVTPSPAALAAQQKRLLRTLGTPAIIGAVIGLCFVAPEMIILWIILGFVVSGFVNREDQGGRGVADFRSRHRSAEAQYRALEEQWKREASNALFDGKFQELKCCRDQLNDLPNLRARGLQELNQQRQKFQLKRFLETFEIDRATISGIGPGRKAVLESYNIETAWDLTPQNIMRVPGFGPGLTSNLISWRQSAEAKFRFDPSKGVDPRDIADLDRELMDTRVKLENQLVNGVTELTQIRNQIVMRRSALRPQLEAAHETLLQAEADARAAGG